MGEPVQIAKYRVTGCEAPDRRHVQPAMKRFRSRDRKRRMRRVAEGAAKNGPRRNEDKYAEPESCRTPGIFAPFS